MTAMTPVPEDDPLMVAWRAFQSADAFTNAKRSAALPRHVDGALWAAFMAGYRAQPPAGDASLLREALRENESLRESLSEWRESFAMPDETNAAAICRISTELLARAATPASSGDTALLRNMAQFIVNGVEFGYIQQPASESTEEGTLAKARELLAAASSEPHKLAAQTAWPPMSTGQRKGEPERNGLKWLHWFCGMVWQWAWYVPPGDARLACEIADMLVKDAAPAPKPEPDAASSTPISCDLRCRVCGAVIAGGHQVTEYRHKECK